MPHPLLAVSMLCDKGVYLLITDTGSPRRYALKLSMAISIARKRDARVSHAI